MQCMLQAQAERAFWMAKDKRLQKEMFDLNAAVARLQNREQRASFCRDVTTDADKFEKIIVPLDHRIKKVTNNKCNCEHSPCYTGEQCPCFSCRRPMLIVVRLNAVMSAHCEYNGVQGSAMKCNEVQWCEPQQLITHNWLT